MPVVFRYKGFRFFFGGGSQRIEPIKLGFGIAGTVVRRSIGQSVAGHDPIEATSANPVMYFPLLRFRVHELDPGSGWHDESVGRLRDVDTGTVSIRRHGKGPLGAKPKAGAVAGIVDAIKTRQA